MADKVSLKIYDIVGSPIWVSTDDGQKVFDKIVAAFEAGRAIELSFANHENLISAFFNAAIGQLYNGDYTDEFLDQHLTYTDINEDDLEMLKRTIANAKRYFANRPAYDRAWRDLIDDEEE